MIDKILKNNILQKEFIVFIEEKLFSSLKKGDQFSLEVNEIHHIRKVFRKKGNLTAFISDGKGNLYHIVIDEYNNGKIVSDLIKMDKPSPGLHLAQAIVDKNQMEWIVRKSVEIGIESIIFFYSDYSQKNISIENRRLYSIVKSAALQSKNPFLPRISFFSSDLVALTEEIFNLTNDIRIFWGEWREENQSALLKGKEYFFINGPEGGWSDTEKYFLKRNFPYIQFSKNVLKSETAAIAGLLYARFMHETSKS